MTDVASGCFIVPRMLSLLRDGPGSPLWRSVVTLGNCVTVNFVCLVVILACIVFIVRRMCFWYVSLENLLADKRDRPYPLPYLSPYLAALAFAVVPQFADKVTRLSPSLFSLTPLFLSAAVVASLNTRLPLPEDDEIEDVRRLVQVRLALAGALAAVGVWESTYGLLFAPVLLALPWFAFIRRESSLASVSAPWVGGFAAAFALEFLIVPNCSLTALMPHWVQISGFIVYFFIGLMPLAIVRRFGENRWTLGGWAVVLLVFMTITGMGHGRFARQSASERFARHVLADVGDRKFLIGDGRFDVLFDEYKPADVKRIGTTTVEEREFLIKMFGTNESVTNRVVVVSRYYYAFPEMAEAFCDVNPRLTVLLPRKSGKERKLTKEEQAKIVQARQEAFRKKLEPLLTSLKAVEGFKDVPESLRQETIEKAREDIRTAWKNGFGGLKLSETLLRLDLACKDAKALESDAISALILDREDPAANTALGQLRLESGKLEDAERYLRKGVKGGGVLAMSRLAMLLVNTGRFQEAGEWARKAVEKNPSDWNLRQPLAAALIEAGRYEEAERELNEIRRLAGEEKKMSSVEAFVSGARRRLVELKSGKKSLAGDDFNWGL